MTWIDSYSYKDAYASNYNMQLQLLAVNFKLPQEQTQPGLFPSWLAASILCDQLCENGPFVLVDRMYLIVIVCTEYTIHDIVIMYTVGVSALCWCLQVYICRKQVGHCHDKKWSCFILATMNGPFSYSRSYRVAVDPCINNFPKNIKISSCLSLHQWLSHARITSSSCLSLHQWLSKE